MSDRHDALVRLFDELCEQPPDERARALAEIEARDPDLGRELAELLAHDARDAAGPLLDRIGGVVAVVGAAAARSRFSVPGIRVPGLRGDRYEMVRRLGEGGLGVVYEAVDHERGERVALKTFRRRDPDAMFRLKREFRALAGIDHPNLVRLHDLVVDDAGAFFTMELVAGEDALAHVRAGAAGGPPYDEPRLRAMLPQLAQGLDALHGMGKLHRDIKPANVRVARDGRVVVLDFGLAVDVGELEQDSLLASAAGTLAYMSPEQACAERDLGPATDWYAFGVLLYEALTGTLPFTGRPVELLAQKTQRVPPPPRQVRPDVPADLDALCGALLARDPRQRPRGTAVLEALGVRRDAPPVRGDGAATGGPAITGRAPELAALFAALDAAQHAREARVVVVSGPSGIGKTAVVAEFLRRLGRRHGDAVVLRGRCYEAEAVSYRAMDAVVDELSRYWRKLPDLEAGYLCPQEPHLLPVLFPVLGRVPAVAQRRRQDAPADPIERRDRAYAALRETFRKLAIDRPTVMFVDDIQWADADSMALIADLLRPPHMPPLLVVLAGRDDAAADGPLPALLARLGYAATVVAVPPLPPDTAEAIAASLLGAQASEQVRRIAREADGNPYFLTELCRSAQLAEAGPTGHATVDDLVRARVAARSDPERAALELIAAAGEPIAEQVVEAAAAIAPASIAAALRALRAASLISTAAGSDDQAVECFHLRVRTAVMSALSADARRTLHRRLAEALELAGHATAERLTRHWVAAGDATRATPWAARAAEEALGTLDFARAAELFGLVLQLAEPRHALDADERRRLEVRRGDALVEAGRPAEAIAMFEQAIAAASADERLVLQKRVVQQLFSLGEVDRGLAAARELARGVGWRLPRSALATLVRVLVGWLRLRLGRDDPAPRDVSDAPRRRVQFEISSALARSLTVIDTLHGVLWMQYAIRVAAPLRDPEVRARSLAMRSAAASIRGDLVRGRRLVALADALAADGSPVAKAYACFGRGLHGIVFTQDWPTVIASFDDAVRCWRDAGRGEGWDLDGVVLMTLLARNNHGELRVLADLVPQLAMQYARSGRRAVEVTLRARHAMLRVFADAPDAAIAEVADALGGWPDKRRAFLMQHMWGMLSVLNAELYRGRAAAAAQVLASEGRLLRRSLLSRVTMFRIELDYAEGRVHLAQAAQRGGDARAGARRAVVCARRLERLGSPQPRAYAEVLRAGAAQIAGDVDAAVAALREALAWFDATGTRLHAACVRRQLGAMLGGDEGSALAAEANLWLARQGVAQPARVTALWLPGWRHPDVMDTDS